MRSSRSGTPACSRAWCGPAGWGTNSNKKSWKVGEGASPTFISFTILHGQPYLVVRRSRVDPAQQNIRERGVGPARRHEAAARLRVGELAVDMAVACAARRNECRRRGTGRGLVDRIGVGPGVTAGAGNVVDPALDVVRV